jgi:hypothetical protein
MDSPLQSVAINPDVVIKVVRQYLPGKIANYFFEIFTSLAYEKVMARKLQSNLFIIILNTGADPGFQVRGGALKKITPSGRRHENIWGISCEKSRFYAQKLYFFRLRREARKFFGYFV